MVFDIKQFIHLMCGVPGSGKSTWISRYLNDKSIWISRDEIRKSFVGENVNNANYFSHEDEVFSEFIKTINQAIADGYEHIYIDATHISVPSRAKVLNRIQVKEDTALILEVFETPLEECLKRNETRTGFARVPDSAIQSMWRGFQRPRLNEFEGKYKFKRISICEHFCKEGNNL